MRAQPESMVAGRDWFETRVRNFWVGGRWGGGADLEGAYGDEFVDGGRARSRRWWR